MQAYSVKYLFNGIERTTIMDAKDKKSVTNKIARKHKAQNKDIKIIDLKVIGYL